MCAICGCGIDAGEAEQMFARDYKCSNCRHIFKAFGVIRVCPNCQSRKSTPYN